MRFLPNVIIICFREKTILNCKNNYKCNKLANFWPDIMNKINYKILVVILYISSKLKLRNNLISLKKL